MLGPAVGIVNISDETEKEQSLSSLLPLGNREWDRS